MPSERSRKGTPARPRSKALIDVFISHSSRDVELAKSLIDLLQAALRLDPQSIRCTSVPGYRLPGGERTDDLLRQEIAGCRVFIALVTRASLHSHYVLFELGARWGAGAAFLPLIGRGVDRGTVPRPLADLNCLDLRDRADVHQMLEDVAEALDADPARAATYVGDVEKILKAAGESYGSFRRRLSGEELRILRAVFAEKDGRLLSHYKNVNGKAIDALVGAGLLNLVNARYFLTDEGDRVTREYLQDVLEKET